MKFYRENKINPAASCLPMLFQIPVFIALFYTLKHFNTNFLCTTPLTSGTTNAAKAACDAVLQTAVNRGELSWLHFIPNITVAVSGVGYVLLVVYVASQMASGLFMAPTAQKSQRIIFMVMPLVFVFVIANFPAGLVIYWVTTNLWTVGQGLVTRRLVQRTPAPTIGAAFLSNGPTRGGRRHERQRRVTRAAGSDARSSCRASPTAPGAAQEELRET